MQEHYERLFASGQLIFDEGDSGDFLYVIQSGEVELSRAGAQERRLIARLGPGEFFGEMSVVLGESRSARAVAVSECRLLELDGETFESMCVERPEVALRVIQRLAKRLIETERRLSALGIDDLLRPVVRALVRRAQPAGEDGMRVAESLRDLASESGLTMLEAHRALQQLLDRKVVRLVDDVLYASDLESLSSCLDTPA